MFQSQRVADLMGNDQEQVLTFVAAQGPALGFVKVSLAPEREESVSERTTWKRKSKA